jgi:hypothetical protein
MSAVYNKLRAPEYNFPETAQGLHLMRTPEWKEVQDLKLPEFRWYKYFSLRFRLSSFYASVRLDIRRSTQIKDGENVLGNRTKVKIVKNKVAPPFKVAEFDIMYGEGISKTGEILDLAVEFEIIKKAGSWFSYGETKLGQGRDAVKTLIKDNPELADELEVKIKAHIKELANE